MKSHNAFSYYSKTCHERPWSLSGDFGRIRQVVARQSEHGKLIGQVSNWYIKVIDIPDGDILENKWALNLKTYPYITSIFHE